MEGQAVILAEGYFLTTDAKTAHGLVRYSARYKVVGVIDSGLAGRDAGEVLDGKYRGIPIYATLEDALNANPDINVLIIGVATAGGRLPGNFRPIVMKALEKGISIVSGLHEFLSDDPLLADLARKHGARIIDVRKMFRDMRVFYTGEIKGVRSLKIVVVGTDSAIGKRTTAVMLTEELNRLGVKTVFIGTGQTAWMQGARYGIVLDAMINDFITGGLEHEIVRAYREENPDVIVVPGQGSLLHPVFPGSYEILALVQPDIIILQHAPGRSHLDGFPEYPMPDIDRYMHLIELITGRNVYAVTINHENMTPGEVEELIKFYEEKYGVVACDPVLHGMSKVALSIIRDYIGGERERSPLNALTV
ncbi:MAG: DUF1611 domain-containing protein [Desulfurococcales archaeon]|nr:DUF1611 domain-containing protein [Desulfurococcales archaeon]